MAEKINDHDFVEIDYTGKLTDGTIFDTTSEKKAKEAGISAEKSKFGPLVICGGEKQVLPGLDAKLVGQEIEKEIIINLTPEEAFGKRDIKKLRIMPINEFKQHKVQPQPGLQINVDGELGTIARISGGRIIVNFNHPLAGKEVVYEIKVNRKVTDNKEQLTTFLNSALKIPEDKIKVVVEGEKAEITLPLNLPEQFTGELGKKLAELTKLKEVIFNKIEEKKSA